MGSKQSPSVTSINDCDYIVPPQHTIISDKRLRELEAKEQQLEGFEFERGLRQRMQQRKAGSVFPPDGASHGGAGAGAAPARRGSRAGVVHVADTAPRAARGRGQLVR